MTASTERTCSTIVRSKRRFQSSKNNGIPKNGKNAFS